MKTLFVRVKMVWDQTAKLINSGADDEETQQIHQYFQNLINDLTSGVTPEASNDFDCC